MSTFDRPSLAMPLETVDPPLRAEILRGVSAFDTLEPAWQAALAQMSRPSLFVTPEFLRLSWQHLSNERDEPWFVVVRRDSELVGLLPLVLRRGRYRRLPFRILLHMGMLAGDRPGLVHTVNADQVWHAALQAVVAHRAAWSLLDLQELDEPSWPLSHQCALGVFGRHGLRASTEADTYAGYLRTEGDWETYLQARSRNTRQGFLRRERQLREVHPDLRIETIDDPDSIARAFDRYLAIEATGWKSQEAIGLWSDPREPDFHRELLRQLARSGRASVWLLSAGQRDIAGLVRLRHGAIVYERHSAFDPAYARYSPSTYLCMQAVRALFGTEAEESDVLGLHEPLENRPAISAWYPEVRVTRRLVVMNAPRHYGPLLWLHGKLKPLHSHWQRRLRGAGAAASPAPVSTDKDSS